MFSALSFILLERVVYLEKRSYGQNIIPLNKCVKAAWANGNLPILQLIARPCREILFLYELPLSAIALHHSQEELILVLLDMRQLMSIMFCVRPDERLPPR